MNCTYTDCTRPARARAMCSKHYQAFKRANPHLLKPASVLRGMPLLDRVMARVVYSDSGCWNYLGPLTDRGYGRVPVYENGRATSLRAHRVTYEGMVGPIPDGLVLDHLCRNTSCVNPAHLEPVTQHVNVLRGQAPTAVNATKTHCPKGHDLGGDNAYPNSNNRGCRTCVLERLAERVACPGCGTVISRGNLRRHWRKVCENGWAEL